MTSLIQNSAFDRIINARLLWPIGSVEQSTANRSRKRLRSRFGTKQNQRIDRKELLKQLYACYEELNVAIMGEMEERERMKLELREKVCQQLVEARILLDQYQGPDGRKNMLNIQYDKFASMVSDPERRLKYDTLRKLASSIEILISKSKIPEENSKVGSTATSLSKPQVVADSKPEAEAPAAITVKATAATTVKATVAESIVDSPKEPDLPKAIPAPETLVEKTTTTVATKTHVEKETPVLKVAVASSSPEQLKNDTPSVQQILPPKEVLSEAAKMKQQPQILWRTPTRLEPLRGKEKKQEKKSKSIEELIKPIDHPKEPERLALKYKTKVKKRSAEEPLAGDLPFKKPFPMHNEQSKPLFQRRHQLPPRGPSMVNSRDPRTYGEYCQRRMMQLSNQQRFEIQNQQYFKPRPSAPLPVQRPSAEARPFMVPAPVAPTRPSFRPPAPPRASVPPTVTTPPAPVPAAPRSDAKKTNPVYSTDGPIRLGKKETPKKQATGKPSTVVPEKPKEVPKKDDQIPKDNNVAPKTTQVDEPKAKICSDEKELSKNLMDLLKGFGDQDKVKQILDVMNKKSDDEVEEKKKTADVKIDELNNKVDVETKESTPKEVAATKGKRGRKLKRICSKADIDSSSEDDTARKDENKKEKPKKRGKSGNREVSALIDNVTDWISKGGEMNYTRRRGAIIQPSTIISDSPPPKQTKKRNSNDKSRSGSSDEDVISESKTAPDEGDSLLTVTKSPPAKGKQKNKDVNFIYNDKSTVHYNSNYSSNCALCSFNGSAIVEHYVYEHKQYEVFVSRVSPKMADIIRADLFLTNGTVTNEGGEDEKIRFKCYFCLTWKELSRSGWIEHMASHTGEYRYRCTSCPVMSKTEELESCFYHEKSCLKPTMAVYNNIEFQDNHIYGFICNECNYIQIRRVNMERHLKREHPSTDVPCSRFSIVNYKIDAKPIIDEDQVMEDLDAPNIPTVMIPLHPKAELFEPCEIVNQPYTDDDETENPLPLIPLRRTDIRLQSVHIGSAGVSGEFIHQPFSFKFEQELQGSHISSSGESPMSPEPMPSTEEPILCSEADAIVPTLQIQSVQGGFDMNKVLLKREKTPAEYDSDASDKTEDFNMSDGAEDGQKNGNNSSNGGKESKGNDGKQGESNSNPPASSGGSTGGSSSLGSGAAGSGGGDDGDDRKKEEFPLPFNIKVEKDENEKKKKDESTTSENIVIKTEKPDEEPTDPPLAEGHFDFVELVLDSTRIEHVAYIEHQSDILFLCLMPGCQYHSKKSQDFITHISRKHSQVVWDGYCHPCQSQIVIAENCTINNELQHMLNVHARRKTPTPEVPNMPAGGTQNMLRIRRIPGDTLSKGDLNPPPLAPILPTGAIIAGPSGIPLVQQPIIITSAATIAPVTMTGNTIITPTHTIPAQIRPVIQQTPVAAIQPPALAPVSTNAGSSSGINASVSSMANMKLNTVRLKPWTNMVTTKNQEHCRSMLEEVSLLCLYKCMSRSCAFTTNNRFFMEQHLQLHENLHNTNTNGRKCWLECAYCDIIAANNNVLLAHIDAEHATCGFQCNLCFYRSRDPTNVVVHQKTYHPTGNLTKKILIMPDHLKSFGDDEWKSMQESLRKNVLPLHCTICRESFYILSAYMNHLSSHGVAIISCQVCNMGIDKKCMARHLLLHSIGLYECVYCLFGANTKSTMALHVSNAHCSKPLYCCVRYNKKRPDGVDYPPNKIESMELKTMSCTVSPDLFKRCNYTPEQLNFKPISLQINQSMEYGDHSPMLNKIMSNAVVSAVSAGPNSSSESGPASNIQIQITDEAGRPLIISIPVQNAKPPTPSGSAQPTSVMGLCAPAPPPIQMPMISSVQGGVQSFASPLPVISSVQGMVPLPPLTAIQRNDGLPVISCVQSVAQLPPESSSIIPPANTVVPKPPTLTALTSGGIITLPNIPGITITAKPITTSAMSSTPIITNVQSLPSIQQTSATQGPLPMATTRTNPPQEPVSSSSVSSTEPKGDMYKTTVAEADTQSSNSNGGGMESDEDSRADSSKSGTPVPSPSPQPGCSKETTLLKKFSSTTQIRIDFLFKGSIDKFDRLEKKVSQMIEHTGFCGMTLNVCGVDGCHSKFTDPVKLNLHLLKFHNLSNYNCYHCSDRFKTAHELITHVKTHGRHRYLCFLCDRKSHFLKMMILHVQHDHNSTDVILTYLHPKKRDIHNDLVVICPQNVTAGQLQDYVNNILKEESISEKKRFAPSEIDQLPVEEIFTEDLFCASCDYTTKIRKNLKRHLEKHNETSAVSISTLPELECMPPDVSEEPEILYASNEEASSASIPQKVDPIKLYQCGICKFDCPPVFSDLRTHVYRTHRNEKKYTCPHCNAVLNDGFICMDKIANHLRLHGANLYKCNYQECDYLREEKILILAHIKHSHCNSGSVLVLREAHYTADPEWQCDLCEVIRPSRAEMVQHMTKDHKLTNNQYKCSYCAYKSSDNNSFKAHFARHHPKSEMLIISLFHELPPKKIPVVQSESIKKERSSEGRKFSCGIETCSFVSANSGDTKKHFLEQHPDQTLVVFDDSAIEKEKRKRFDYFVKYVCNYCQVQCDLMDDMVEHWSKLHKEDSGGKPLMYKLFKLVRCFYCDKLSTYYDIKTHAMVNHPGQIFACVDHQNAFKCGECPYVVTGEKIDLLKHFKVYHSASKNEDPCDYMDDEFLHRMLEQNNSLYTCNHCNLTFESRYEYENHIDVCVYAGEPSSFSLTPKSVRIRHICSCCTEVFSNEYSIAKHMRTHLAQYNCRYCKREFKQLKLLNQHQILLHSAHDKDFLLKDLSQFRSQFLKIKMLFPNGLVLSKVDAHRTVCGSVEDIINYARTVNDEEMSELLYSRAIEMPLIYENETGDTVHTICKDFLDSRPTMTLELDQLSHEQLEEICEQVYLLAKATSGSSSSSNSSRALKRRSRPRKKITATPSNTDDDDDDDDWKPDRKRPCSKTTLHKLPAIKKEKQIDSDFSASDDELLINLKKECAE